MELQPYVLYQYCLQPAVSGQYSGFTVSRFRKKLLKFPFRTIVTIFHCSTGDTFGNIVIESFGTVLLRTGDSVALPTVGSKITPMCKATVKNIRRFSGTR